MLLVTCWMLNVWKAVYFPNTEFNQDRLWETSTVLIKVVSYAPPLIS